MMCAGRLQRALPMVVLVLFLVLCAVGCARQAERPNVLVVVLDTLRRDVAGMPTVVTPNPLRDTGLTLRLSALAADGVAFADAQSAAPWTVPSHASLFTGRLPGRHGCTSLHPRLNNTQPTFAEHLRDAGYQTAAFYSNIWLADRTTGLLRGFVVKREAAIGSLFELRSAVGDQGGAESVRNIDAWLDARSDGHPFLLFANFLETHLSYDPPQAYRSRRLSDLPATDTVSIAWAHELNAGRHDPAEVDWRRVARLYAGDAWSVDRLLGAVLDLLEEHGLADDTIVVVTSDHGENLGDHGLMDHQYSVHETLLAVPLVVRVPSRWRDRFDLGAAPGTVREDPVLLTDLYASVLALAGLTPDETTPGSRSLFDAPAPPDRPLVSQYAGPGPALLEMLQGVNPDADLSRLAPARSTVKVGDLRLTIDGHGGVVLHDVARDPGQTRDLAAERPDDVARLLALLADVPAIADAAADGDIEIDEATRRQLESLGYVH